MQLGCKWPRFAIFKRDVTVRTSKNQNNQDEKLRNLQHKLQFRRRPRQDLTTGIDDHIRGAGEYRV
jgi:hypothetical protein